MEERNEIRKKYSYELNEINYILQNLENGRYYENSNAQCDGYLATNIQKLKKHFNELLDKIEYNENSIKDEIKEAKSKYGV
ncbi:MAG: hypothetical protein LKH93_11130 [Clostridium beijerinckii]|nr:hypothetical protein [Clostridium beijerinckii]MCI1578931.1 hypothetical protein [Clostridium beijerinckii]MCI1582240.1 hypothetical protein [Clostridium beijerinckii]MCI1622757.1 hypothetical protein [Clostridium beijerinckii]